MSDPGPIFILAGGGTGGHLYPGLAVAEALTDLEPAARIVFACSGRPIDRRILNGRPYGVVCQPVVPIPSTVCPLAWWAFWRAWRASARQSRDMLADLQPAGVLGLGGFAAGPLTARAARAGVRTGLLNPDAVPGKANRYLARRVDAVFTGFPAAAEHFRPDIRRRCRPVGCPVRSGLDAANRDDSLAQLGLDASRRVVTVLGGSQGAQSVSLSLAELAGDLAKLEGWQVYHVAGPGKVADLQDRYAAAGTHATVVEYCERMDWAYAATDVAVCRGGASTIAELALTGTPAVILPYPYHRDRQQAHNAAELVDAGGAVLVEDAVDPPVNAARLREILLPILETPGRVEAMSAAARRCGKPDAARLVARFLLGEGG